MTPSLLARLRPRHYAEHSGYFRGKPGFAELIRKGGEVTFYDSIENKPVFIAPRVRSL